MSKLIEENVSVRFVPIPETMITQEEVNEGTTLIQRNRERFDRIHRIVNDYLESRELEWQQITR